MRDTAEARSPASTSVPAMNSLPNPRAVVAAILFFVVLVTVAACGDDDAAEDPEPAPDDGGPTSLPADDAGATSVPADDEADDVADAAEAGGTEPEADQPEPPDYDFAAVSPIVQDFVDQEGLNGAGLIVVHRDHGVIHQEHWGEFDEDRISLVASSSKMVTAGVLLALHDDGLLDIDAPVADVVDWGAANPEITPAQLLSNSSGLVGLAPNPGYAPYLCQYGAAGTLQDCGEQIFTTPDDDADVIAPDTEFRYGGGQWQVAGAVAEAASGRSWAQLIDEIYVEPCGLETLAYNNHFGQMGSGFVYPETFAGDPSTLDATDNPNMEGGAYVTTGDYGQLLLMHLRDGTCGEEQVLSPEALDRMHTDRIAEVYDSADAGPGYGMGWWVDRESGRLSDAGAYGSVPWLDLEDGYGAFLVIEDDAATGNVLAGQLYDVIEQIVVESGSASS